MPIKKQYVPPRYIQVLKEIRQMIDAEYSDGGAFPTAREMCARFRISSVTYMKIFEILRSEGVLHVEGRSGGTCVLPARGRTVKVGVIFSMERNPYIGAGSFYLKVVHGLSQSGISVHVVTTHDPYQLYDLCAQFAFRMLIWFRPPPKQLERLETSGVNLPLVLFDDFPFEIRNFSFPYLSGSYEFRCRTLAEFVKEKQYGKLLYAATFSASSYYGRALFRFFGESGIPLGENDFVNLSRVDDHFLKKIRQSRCKILIAEGPAWLYARLYALLKQLPDGERPKLMLFDGYPPGPESVREKRSDKPDFWFRVNNPLFLKLIVDRLLAYLWAGVPHENAEFDVTVIDPGKKLRKTHP